MYGDVSHIMSVRYGVAHSDNTQLQETRHALVVITGTWLVKLYTKFLLNHNYRI